MLIYKTDSVSYLDINMNDFKIFMWALDTTIHQMIKLYLENKNVVVYFSHEQSTQVCYIYGTRFTVSDRCI